MVIRPIEMAKSPTDMWMIFTGPLLINSRTFDENKATMPVMKLTMENAKAITPVTNIFINK